MRSSKLIEMLKVSFIVAIVPASTVPWRRTLPQQGHSKKSPRAAAGSVTTSTVPRRFKLEQLVDVESHGIDGQCNREIADLQ